jgi:hypothetical protein
MWMLVSVRLEILLFLKQDNAQFALNIPQAHVDARFGPFGDSANLDAR